MTSHTAHQPQRPPKRRKRTSRPSRVCRQRRPPRSEPRPREPRAARRQPGPPPRAAHDGHHQMAPRPARDSHPSSPVGSRAERKNDSDGPAGRNDPGRPPSALNPHERDRLLHDDFRTEYQRGFALCAITTVRLEWFLASCVKARRTSCAVSFRNSMSPIIAVTGFRTFRLSVTAPTDLSSRPSASQSLTARLPGH
jgi:hypothetical protein